MKGLSVYFYLYLHIVAYASSLMQHKFKIHRNWKSVMQPIEVVRDVSSRTECVVRCTETNFCVSANYGEKSCFMFDRVDVSNLVSSVGSVYMHEGMYLLH